MSRIEDRPPDVTFERKTDALDPVEQAASEVQFDFEVSPDSVKAGTETIRRFWATLPNAPGVYRMFDKAGEVLYIGKAKNLKSRVGSYARGQGHSNRIDRMIAETAAMEFVTTNSETEALLLEATLIKQLRPRYNVLLRDDKSLPYILIATDHVSPQLAKHRGARQRKGDYFGPFANVWAVNHTLNALQRAFLLRVCTDSYYENRTRPCLLHQIKRCSGPCTGEISHGDYADLVQNAQAFLCGKSATVKERMAREMQEASQTLEFEKAARIRDRLSALSALQPSSGAHTQSVEEADVFAIDEQAGQFCVEVFFFRNWQNWGNRAYFPKAEKSLSPSEVLTSFLVQFYDDKPPPRLVLTSHTLDEVDLVADALSSRSPHRVEICMPRRAEKFALVSYAQRNAREALGRKLAETVSQTKLLEAVGQAFGLEHAPRRIEVYDNSHIMGTNAVGAMIVAGANGFMKTHYRSFTIKSEEVMPGDDLGMMKEVLGRRFGRLLKEVPVPAEDSGEFPAWPDIVLIDGGKGQWEVARSILEELGVTGVSLISIAKGRDREAGRETFFMAQRPPFKLPPRDPALYFIQRLRDEAHRFAIGAHRAKRKREMTRNPLDEIVGIGPARKRALLQHFGSARAVKGASLEELMQIPGVNAATAKTVFHHFRNAS